MRTQEKRATRFRSIQTSLLFVIVPAVIISMAVLSLMGYLSSKAIIQTSAGNEMSQCLSVAMGSIEMSLSNNRMVAETMARGVEAVQRQAVKGGADRVRLGCGSLSGNSDLLCGEQPGDVRRRDLVRALPVPTGAAVFLSLLHAPEWSRHLCRQLFSGGGRLLYRPGLVHKRRQYHSKVRLVCSILR